MRGCFSANMWMFSNTYAPVLSSCSDGIVHLYATSYKLKTKAFALECQNINEAISRPLIRTLQAKLQNGLL